MGNMSNFTGGGRAPAPISSLSDIVGSIASHMATRIPNDEDSDGATYLPPVESEPVIRLLQSMITERDGPTSTRNEEQSCPEASDNATPPENVEDTNATQASDANHENGVTGICAASDALSPQSHAPDNNNSPGIGSAANEAIQEAGATAKIPRGRLVLLEKVLNEENERRIALMQEEHDRRMQLLQEDHDDVMKKRQEKHKAEMEIPHLQKQIEQNKLQKLLSE
ncbi:hypothetical protein MTO96_049211 [Rhipicephalus appendiculatus]